MLSTYSLAQYAGKPNPVLTQSNNNNDFAPGSLRQLDKVGKFCSKFTKNDVIIKTQIDGLYHANPNAKFLGNIGDIFALNNISFLELDFDELLLGLRKKEEYLQVRPGLHRYHIEKRGHPDCTLFEKEFPRDRAKKAKSSWGVEEEQCVAVSMPDTSNAKYEYLSEFRREKSTHYDRSYPPDRRTIEIFFADWRYLIRSREKKTTIGHLTSATLRLRDGKSPSKIRKSDIRCRNKASPALLLYMIQNGIEPNEG